MDVDERIGQWLRARNGIEHRDTLIRAGIPVTRLRDFVRRGRGALIRRAWIALPDADPDLALAARAGGRVTCIALARRRGWWIPPAADARPHLHLRPAAGSAGLGPGWDGVLHWTQPVAPTPGRALEGTVEDALAHIAVCQPPDVARVLWESAARKEGLAPEYLRAVRWRGPAARELAHIVTGLSDSGLETLVVAPLARSGLRVRQQVKIAGRFVDALVGDLLVLQIDGFEFHSASADRTRDIAHDAELRLRGYTVLRFSYAQIVHDWPTVEATIRRALALGLHAAR
ncbi:DUF559 domain-containing protein [Microbacterium sp. 4R-513]|uniref:endonuclease domain-containing protein n=1 Tax=Microbacterium sp. 4R-513 TaxID=2567934 RepID=UPI0013E12AA1|nr:DUF559 domain-containing protein [Microbacterium sp. 4R-513]QIG38509.1 DUF559 domain-containing protein [Microbacterium sp. 4R-513]